MKKPTPRSSPRSPQKQTRAATRTAKATSSSSASAGIHAPDTTQRPARQKRASSSTAPAANARAPKRATEEVRTGVKTPRTQEGAASTAAKAKSKRARAFEIREMDIEDLPKVYLLGEQLFTAELWPNLYRTWDEYELVEFFASAQEYCYVAERNGKILGFILGTVIEKRHSAWNYGWVVWLGVSPRAKGQGVGRKLVDKLTDIFIEDGVRILLVDTDAKNTNAIQFFERLGFGSKNHHVYMTQNLTRDPRYTEHKEHEEFVEADLRRRRKKLRAAKRVRTQARSK